MNNDLSHLKTLSILHYVYAGLIFFGSIFFLVYILAGVVITQADPGSLERQDGFNNYRDDESERAFRDMERNVNASKNTVGGIVICFGAVGLLFGVGMGTLNIMVGRNLATQKGRTFCMVISGINCINVPFGLTLAIFTFVVLGRPTVVSLFNGMPVYNKPTY